MKASQRADPRRKTTRRQGFAIPIGHPSDMTLTALNAWPSELHERGLAVMPLMPVGKRLRREAPTAG